MMCRLKICQMMNLCVMGDPQVSWEICVSRYTASIDWEGKRDCKMREGCWNSTGRNKWAKSPGRETESWELPNNFYQALKPKESSQMDFETSLDQWLPFIFPFAFCAIMSELLSSWCLTILCWEKIKCLFTIGDSYMLGIMPRSFICTDADALCDETFNFEMMFYWNDFWGPWNGMNVFYKCNRYKSWGWRAEG